MSAIEIPLHERVLLALRLRFPGASLRSHTADYGNTMVIQYAEDNGPRHFYATPPGQNYRQHDVAWLSHRFAALITPAYAAAQVRGTLEQARSES